ncbi:MAG TPA: GxxExxY protein [Tepidisphaeraceae bacterium]|jgi:GxxExxY protein
MPIGDNTSDEIERVCREVVDAAFKVHQKMGPGLLESVYEACLAYELTKRGLRVQIQVPVPVVYDGVTLEVGFRLDLLVEDLVIVELKSVEKMEPIFQAILQNYLRLTGKRVGFLINFNVVMFKDGVKRIVV